MRSVLTMREGDLRVGARARADRPTTSERGPAAARTAHAQAANHRRAIAVLAGMAGSALIVALVSAHQARSMVRRMRRAAALADRIAGGDLSARLADTGEAEIGQFERSFNAMGASLERSHRELAQLAEAQAALRRVATLVARGSPPSEILETVARELGGLIRTENARIVRFEADGSGTMVAAWGVPELELPAGTNVSLEGDSVAALVLRTGRPVRMDTYEGAPGTLAAHMRAHGIGAAVGAPIHVAGRLWGAVTAAAASDELPPPDAEARLAEYTDLIGTAIANTQAHADLVASRARVVLATDQARRRLERDLHDGVQQRLVSIGLGVRNAEASVPPEMPEIRAALSAVSGELTGALDDVREISRGVHPAILSEAGLGAALKALARRSAVAVELDMRLDVRLPEPVEVAAYYVVAEALANAAKHAHASRVCVSAIVDDGRLCVSVCDDGIGGADPACGSGLIGLTDRIEALGGTLTIDSPIGRGTSLTAVLPLGGT